MWGANARPVGSDRPEPIGYLRRMISLSNLGKSFGDRTLFAGVSLQLNAGECYGLVGANGSGKTTLLDIVSGEVEPSEGSVAIPKRLRLGVLRQDHFRYEDRRILDVALMGNPELWEAMEEKEAILAHAEDHFDADRFSVLEETVQRLDGYTAEARAATILEGLGIPSELQQDPLSTLSGGFKLRVLLAQVLASGPDVLLLDEPTNHLDILSIRWLELFLRDFSGPVVVISHDHRFLDNVATSILDVDYQTVRQYRGNYTDFIAAKEAERVRREKELAGREREIAHHQKFVDRFKAKASKARQAQSKVRMIEKKAESLSALPVTSRRYPTFRFEQRRASGREVLTVKGVRKAFGDNEVLHGVDLLLERDDRLAIIGPNGIGKSTLLKIIVGEVTPDEGEAEWGYEAHPGYFAQDHREGLGPPTRTAEDWIWDFCPERDIGWVRGRLALMLFSGDEAKKRLSALSGGEAARLVFAKIGLLRPNVLVLDEPTNHLDLESIEALVEAVRSFEGTVILVSHDRWFVGQLATRIVEIREDGIRDYRGSYEEYVHFCGDDHLDADRVILKAKKEKRRKDAPSSSRPSAERTNDAAAEDSTPANRWELRERRDELTASIDSAESRIGELDAVFCAPDYHERVAPEKARALQDDRTSLQMELERLMAEWERIEEALTSPE
jgi:ATPase subunit of ABC transporter with duplicated ATPase domains